MYGRVNALCNNACMYSTGSILIVFFFNDTATTEIYTLSLHDALPIYRWDSGSRPNWAGGRRDPPRRDRFEEDRSEEHTSELQSHSDLVCRLLLEKKKTGLGASVEQVRVPRHDLRVLSFWRPGA